MLHVINPAGAPAPVGSYSPAIVANGLVFVSGQIGVDPATGTMRESLGDQTRQALTNLRDLLDAAGSDLGQVVSSTCLLSDMDQFEEFNTAYTEFFDRPFPTRATYGVTLGEGMLVELRVIARVK